MLAKFSAPETPRFLLNRPGLLARLNRWTEFPLTQIAAPAGYGKTTLAAECLRAWQGPKVWIALDEGDSDPGRFLVTLARGLFRAHPVLAESLGRLPSPHASPEPDALFASLVTALEKLPCQLVTVLDDCALLTSPQVRRMALRFLAAAPSQARFLLLTRDPGVLPLSRWRLREELLELGPADLALDAGEFEYWLEARLGLRVDREARERVHRLFEGWLAGLQLLALKVEKEADRRNALETVDPGHAYLFDYLLEEVLRGLPEDWRRFLLETCVLGHLHPDLCDEVRQAGNSAHLLHALHQAQCFLVPLSEGGGFRYHRLFAESLRGLMERWEPGLAPALHRRAARWHLRRGGLEEALEHALAAGDGDTLEALAVRALESLFRASELASLQRHASRIPDALCAGRPWLNIFCAWAYLHAGKEQRAESRLAEAERMVALEGRPATDSRPSLRAQWAHVHLLKGILARLEGSATRALAWLARGEALAPPEASFLRASLAAQAGVMRFQSGDPGAAETALLRAMDVAGTAGHHLAYFGAAYTLAEAMGLLGRLDEAGALLEACMRRVEGLPHGGGPAAGYAHVARARWLRRMGRADEAREEAQAGIAAGLAGGNIRILQYGHATLARLLLEAGEADAACARLEEAERYGLRNRVHWAADMDDIRALRIRCLGPGRERASADAWLARERGSLSAPAWGALDRCLAARAILEWRGDSAAAASLSARWAAHAGRAGWIGAVEELGAADASPPRDAGASRPLRAESPPARELSDREIEVLRAMRDGKSNKEIAGSLFVAPSTIKTHLKSIFNKLEVNNRVRAVTRAVENGLIR